jgi:hypothetical protein
MGFTEPQDVDDLSKVLLTARCLRNPLIFDSGVTPEYFGDTDQDPIAFAARAERRQPDADQTPSPFCV